MLHRLPYFDAVTVAAVPVVVTVGLTKNTSVPFSLLTLESQAVGLAVPCFTVMLPVPSAGAVSSDRVLLQLASNL